MSINKKESAIFGAGCFWGIEYKFAQVPGVYGTATGYAGGKEEKPSYELVCSGVSEYIEVVEVTFDPIKVSYEKLVEYFFQIHDSTQVNGQGLDIGNQYGSRIFYTSLEQKETAEKIKDNNQKELSKIVSTKIVKLEKFWKAENYHQQYIEKNNTSCCSV